MAIILLSAVALRVQGIDFGLPALYDPDEPLFVLTALKLLREGTLNPGWFGHPGSTTIYSLATIDVAVLGGGLLTGRFTDLRAVETAIYTDPGIVVLPGRLFVLLCGLAVIALTFIIARQLFGTVTALVAAVALTLDPVHLRYSQIIRTDMHATVFMLLCVLATIRIVENGRLRDYLLAALSLGFAIATKWPAAFGGVAICGAAILRVREHPEERALQLRHSGIGLVTALASIALASPFLLIDYSTVLENLRGEARSHHPGATGHGFLGNMIWYLAHPLRLAFGTVGVALAIAGIGVAGRANRTFAFVIAPTVLVFCAAISAQSLIWERWTIPLLPFLSISLAVTVSTLWAGLSKHIRRGGGAMAAILAAILIVPLVQEIAAQARERDTDTRRQASAWARANIRAGSTVLVEHLALDLAQQPWTFFYPVGAAGCVDALANLRRRVSYSTVAHVRGERPIIDLGNVDRARLHTCRADVAILVNYDRYRLEPTVYAAELGNYRAVTAGMRTVAIFRPREGEIGGPIVRVVARSR